MAKRLILSALLGVVVLFVWAVITNSILGLRPSIDMRRVADERQVYDLLRANIADPGGYTVNPPLTPAGEFTPGEPVFSVRYSGIGHDSAGRMMMVEAVIALIAVLIAAVLLSVSSEEVMSRYLRRVLFFAAIGLLIAVFSDLAQYGIGGHPLKSALLLAVNDIVAWTLVGLVVARLVKPRLRSGVAVYGTGEGRS